MEIISNILTIAGISITAFLMTLFGGDVMKEKTNLLLILILLALIPLFLSYNLLLSNNEKWIFTIMPFTCFSLVLFGPLLYEYSHHFFNADRQKLFKEWRKYIPFLLICPLIIGCYFLLDNEIYVIILITILSFSFFHLFYYLVILMKLQLKSTKKLKQFYADLTNRDLFWINILIIGLFIVLILDSISGLIILTIGFTGIPVINTLFLLVLIWFLGFYGLTQKRISEDIGDLRMPAEQDVTINLCQTEEYQELKRQLTAILNEKELFKMEDINLNILSRHLDVSSKKVSFLLNQCMHTSFYDLMNMYRLAEFKIKVEKGETKEKTILALAFESGFNSKASFNRIFKHKEGVTPNEYVKFQTNRSQS